MASGSQELARATDAQKFGNMGSYYFLSPMPVWRPKSNKQTNLSKLSMRQFLKLCRYVVFCKMHPDLPILIDQVFQCTL